MAAARRSEVRIGLLFVAAFLLTAGHVRGEEVSGRVVDAAGKAFVGARVASDSSSALTSTDGSFRIEIGEDRLLRIRAGSSSFTHRVQEPLDAVVVTVPSVYEEITVSASGVAQRLGESGSSVVVVTRDDLDRAPQVTLDESLRQVPGFSLFRRTSSRAANPTAQGASLRGVGASGAGRTLVLDDGIPLNDPFGGWVLWGRVPLLAAERIEVLRGGASDLYGSFALGGVIDISRRREGDLLELEASGGTDATGAASLFFSSADDHWRLTLSTDYLTTDGYVAIDRAERGAVDEALDLEHLVGDVEIGRRLGRADTFIRLSGFEERRGNGTPLQVNDTSTRQLSLGVSSELARGLLRGRLYAMEQDYFQTFSAVAEDRNSERLSREQRVPVSSSGGRIVWSGAWRGGEVVTGVDLRRVDGRTDELVFAGATATRTVAGGRQDNAAAFAEIIARPAPRLTVTAGLRADAWSDSDAFRTSGSTTTRFEERSEVEWSPRFSASYALTSRASITSSMYRSFRLPTLNELYRPFRVGSVLTLANEGLTAEQLSGIEAGMFWRASAGSLRLTLFRMEVDDPVANVTLSVTPSLIIRQRRNLGSTRSQGIELEGERELPRGFAIAGGYLYTDSEVLENPAARELEGLRIPQVPLHAGTFLVRWSGGRTATSAEVRCASAQFDDDRNELRLDGFCSGDVRVDVTVTSHLRLFGAVENVTDATVEVARTPTLSLGAPRQIRGGLRLRLGSS
jgi:outer membrane receptor protein involved in Fe transport